MSGIELRGRANGPGHTDIDTDMGYRDKGKGRYMDEFLESNPNPKPGKLRTVPQWPHKRPPQPYPTDDNVVREVHECSDSHGDDSLGDDGAGW